MSAGAEPLGRFAAVTYAAAGTRLVGPLDLAIAEAGRLVILGPNGAGKSLALRLAHGLIAPTAGTVTWRQDAGPARQAMVFQRPVMLRRSAAANLDFALSLKGLDRAERRARRDEALARAGLEALAGRPARVLSAGEQQRLALARAWALRPRVLFLDEPTANLDPAATRAIEAMVREIGAQGCKIVMTTHDLGQARRLAEAVVFLHQGRIAEAGPAEAFFANPAAPAARAFLAGELPA